jgi:hypothetical protein
MMVFMVTEVKENNVGQIVENNGCYTNFGMANHTTNLYFLM